MTTILNVNDREIPRYVSEEILRAAEFEVISVDTGMATLEAIKTRRDIDVVLLDVQLPDVDGFEVCKRIKSDPATANTIVLLSSATFVTPSSKVAGLDSGADGYLVQPYEAPELFATLRSLLRTREAERKANKLAAELRAAMDGRDQFLAMLGHELRNPLSSISLALDVARNGDPAAVKRAMEIVERQSRNLSRIVDDLLDVARLTRGMVALEREVVDLRDVITRCQQSLAEDIRRQGHHVVVELPDAPIHVLGDAVRLEQVTCNLVTNAIKYTPPNGRISITARVAGDRVRYEVTDNGVGMEAAVCERVFDVFVQAAQSIDRSRGGLGLGLALVRQLVEAHGGRVEAHSDGPGHGSRFAIELPLAPADSVARTTGVHTVPPTDDGLRIVIVEDQEDARELLVQALEYFGHRVVTAADGRAGLELILAENPDVALIDIGLPELDGYEVVRGVRARTKTPPRLIAMTGYGQPEDHVRAMNAGFDDRLVKPLSLERLQKLLGDVHRDRGSRLQSAPCGDSQRSRT